MFVRKIQTTAKTHSLQRKQNQLVPRGSALSGEGESSNWMPGAVTALHY